MVFHCTDLHSLYSRILYARVVEIGPVGLEKKVLKVDNIFSQNQFYLALEKG